MDRRQPPDDPGTLALASRIAPPPRAAASKRRRPFLIVSSLRRTTLIAAIPVIAFALWWRAAAPPAEVVVGPPLHLGMPPNAFHAVHVGSKAVLGSLEHLDSELPGHDDIVLLADGRHGLATGMDGWIWKVDLESGAAERFADVPLVAAGARLDPSNPGRLYFCASRLSGTVHPEGEEVGLYALDLDSRDIETVVARVPETSTGPSAEAEVITHDRRRRFTPAEMTEANSRRLAFCNDLSISADGRRIYFTEPFAYEGASMGGGARFEAISLGRNGRIWEVQVADGRVGAVARGMIFADGILIEPEGGPSGQGIESSLLVAETVAFRIVRVHLAGARAGTIEPFIENLPGMPDGLDRDAEGRIWTGFLKLRTIAIDQIHTRPWLKPLLLRLPPSLLPVDEATGVAAFDPDDARPLFFAEHDGSRVHDIAVAIPGPRGIYLASFAPDSRGIHRLRWPLAAGDDRQRRP